MRLSIRARLSWALNITIIAITTLAAVGMLTLVFWFEDSLFYNHLQSDLQDHIDTHRGSVAPITIAMRDTTYYQFPITDETILPEAFRGYPAGGHEVLNRSHAYNLFAQYHDGWGFVLVQDQSEFERYEQLAVACVVLGVLFIWLVGFLSSRRLVEQILRPVLQLAHEVGGMQQHTDTPLRQQYPQDETGQLAAAFEHYRIRVNELLMREQQFSSNVSHELRTPLMVIRGARDILGEDPSPAQIAKQLPRIDNALAQMQQQIELFLKLSRTPDSLAANDVNAAVDAIALAQIEHWRSVAEARGLALQLVVEAPQVPALPSASVVAILNNLLRNALQHTVTGEIKIEVYVDRICVRDTGLGMPTSKLTKIRERGVSGTAEGYGLGLAIVERICTRHGWSLAIDHNHPTGMCVTVRFR